MHIGKAHWGSSALHGENSTEENLPDAKLPWTGRSSDRDKMLPVLFCVAILGFWALQCFWCLFIQIQSYLWHIFITFSFAIYCFCCICMEDEHWNLLPLHLDDVTFFRLFFNSISNVTYYSEDYKLLSSLQASVLSFNSVSEPLSFS